MAGAVRIKRNVGTVKALRGESLTIDLKTTLKGTLKAWMKRSPNDKTYRSFDIIDNRFLKLPKSKTQDYYDTDGVLLESIVGRWFFDVCAIPESGVEADSQIIYTGVVLFENQITCSSGVEITDPNSGEGANTIIKLTDTPNSYGNAGEVLVMNAATDGVEWVANTDTDTFKTLKDTPNTFGTLGQILTVNATLDGLEWITPTDKDTDSFVGLTDTPSTFGTAGQIPSVNTSGDALEWVEVSGETSFQDIAGVEKYKSSEDKRTGYYDVATKTYYPSILSFSASANRTKFGNTTIGGSNVEGLYYKINPQDAMHLQSTYGGGGLGYHSLKFPKVPDYEFSFDLDIFYGSLSANRYEDYIRVNVSVGKVTVNSNVSTWEDAKINVLSNTSTKSFDFCFVDNQAGELIIGFKETSKASTLPAIISMSNLLIRGQGINPIDYYTGWEGFVFNTVSGLSNYRIRETVTITPNVFEGIPILDDNNAEVFKAKSALKFDDNFEPQSAESIIRLKNDVIDLSVSDFLNSWDNLNPTDTQCGYLKIGNIVQLKGAVTGGASGSTIFTLPSKYRPTKSVTTGLLVGNTFGRIDIDPSGNVTSHLGNGAGTIYLNGVSFILD